MVSTASQENSKYHIYLGLSEEKMNLQIARKFTFSNLRDIHCPCLRTRSCTLLSNSSVEVVQGE